MSFEYDSTLRRPTEAERASAQAQLSAMADAARQRGMPLTDSELTQFNACGDVRRGEPLPPDVFAQAFRAELPPAEVQSAFPQATPPAPSTARLQAPADALMANMQRQLVRAGDLPVDYLTRQMEARHAEPSPRASAAAAAAAAASMRRELIRAGLQPAG